MVYIKVYILRAAPWKIHNPNFELYMATHDQILSCTCRFLAAAVECSKYSPELIQLLDMHTHFATGTPGRKVCLQHNYDIVDL